jgi:hypothetical protein
VSTNPCLRGCILADGHPPACYVPTELPSDPRIAQAAERFNAVIVPGERVAARILRSGPWYAVKTRSMAWAWPSKAFVLLEGRRGAWPIDCVRALEPGEELDPLPVWPPQEARAT